MQDETPHPTRPHGHCYTVLIQPDPPTVPLSEKGTLQLQKFADQCSLFEGYEEIARDERYYQVEVLLRRRD